MNTPERKVLLDKNLFRIILDFAVQIDTLKENYLLLYNGSLVCKKWRSIIFKLLVSHYSRYNFNNKQFDFDNIISCCRNIKRNYFESGSNNPYKSPTIQTITKYKFTKPKHYENLVKNSKELKQKHKLINAKFHKLSDRKICAICSTIAQARTICGNYLKKIHLKKVELEQRSQELNDDDIEINDNE